jgi:carbonic anhydrase/acetyltransferase-like protein (isoleucine patch superfamily)
MRDLLLLGGGVHSAEMAEIVERINAVRPTWNLLGFIAPSGAGTGERRVGYPVLGGPDALAAYPTAALVPDNEWPPSLPLPPERLVSLVDSSVFVSRTAQIGPGCVLYPNSFVGLNASLGARVFCLSGSIINHDCVIEERVIVASSVTLAGSVHVEADCFLGQGCLIRQYLRIGRGSVIGMGAVIVRDVPPGSVMVGNPGRLIRQPLR